MSGHSGGPLRAPGSLGRGEVRRLHGAPGTGSVPSLGSGGCSREKAEGGAPGVRGGSRPPDGRGRPRPRRRWLGFRVPRLLGDSATSGGGPRRPGMAAWSPAAAAPLLRGSRGLPLLHSAQRMFASQTEGERKVTQILKEKFPRATAIKVTDISGGCGAMYEIQIESEEFKEKRTVQQHQMVNQALKEEIKGMHGLRIFTSVPKH